MLITEWWLRRCVILANTAAVIYLWVCWVPLNLCVNVDQHWSPVVTTITTTTSLANNRSVSKSFLCLGSSSPSNSLLNLDTFVRSGLSRKDYQNICGIPFVHLYRIVHDETNITAIMSLVQLDLNSGSFANLGRVFAEVPIENIRIVVRFQSQGGQYRLVSNGELSVYSPSSGVELEVPLNQTYNLNEKFIVQLVKDGSNEQVDTSASYTVTCHSIDSDVECFPQFLHKVVTCRCSTLSDSLNTGKLTAGTTGHTGVIIPIVVMFLLFVSAFGFVIYDKLIDKPTQKQPEEQLNLILCMVDNAVYEYNLIYRVGCPTGDLDMNETYIDFEIIGPNDEPIGTPVRFSCALLPDPICGEMHCLIGRITPMPPIHGIQANHSDPKGNYIFFYEYVLVNLKNDRVIEKKYIHAYIENKPLMFRGHSSKTHDDSEDVGLYPDLPIQDLTRVELITFLCYVILLNGAAVMLFEHFNIYFMAQGEQGSLVRSLQDAVFVPPLTLTILFVSLLIYRYNIKRIEVKYEYSEHQGNLKFWRYVSKSFLIFMIKICLVCGAICIYFGFQIVFVLSVFWFASTLVCTSIVLGVWAVANRCLFLKSYYEDGGRIFGPHGSTKRPSVSEHKKYVSDPAHDNKTVYFSKGPSQGLGPKMTNPNYGRAYQGRHRLKRAFNKKKNKSAKHPSHKSSKKQSNKQESKK